MPNVSFLGRYFDAKYFPTEMEMTHRFHHSPMEKLSGFRLGWFLAAGLRLDSEKMYEEQRRRNLPSRAGVYPLLVDIDRKFELNFYFSQSQL